MQDSNAVFFCFHKSASMFIYRYAEHLSHLTLKKLYSINNSPPNHHEYKASQPQSILAPERCAPNNYNEHEMYIVHARNPLDILISQYYSYGYTHPEPSEENEKKIFLKNRQKIQTQTVEEYVTAKETISDLKIKYEKLHDWLKVHESKANILLSRYEDMFYHYEKWNKTICTFLKLNRDVELKLFQKFYKQFKHKPHDNADVIAGTIKPHRRCGHSNQYISELSERAIKNLKEHFEPFKL
jgi:hypothetical protein